MNIITLFPKRQRLVRDVIHEMASRGYHLRAIRHTGTLKRS